MTGSACVPQKKQSSFTQHNSALLSFQLEKPVRAEGNVEVWLMALLQMAQKSMHGVIRTAAMAIQDPNFQLLEFLNMFPAQVGLLGIQFLWTRDSTDALTAAKYDKKIMGSTNQVGHMGIEPSWKLSEMKQEVSNEKD